MENARNSKKQQTIHKNTKKNVERRHNFLPKHPTFIEYYWILVNITFFREKIKKNIMKLTRTLQKCEKLAGISKRI